jgi:aspartate/methionine/tyrosine aminotransferase
MKNTSRYLNWYIHVPPVKFDFRSSGIAHFKHDFALGEVDLSLNYAHGNPQLAEIIARKYEVHGENVFISSEGASGQNTRIIRCIAERNRKKNEAVVEYPTYEPLLRQTQEQFALVKRVERKEKEDFRLDADALRKIVSDNTGLLVLTNPHAPSGAMADKNELQEILAVARECGFFVLCDEIYAEFDRSLVPTVFSVDSEYGIVTTSHTKAYGLGGLKLGIALADKALVDEFYEDVLNSVGNSPNVVQLAAIQLLTKGWENLEKHQQKWLGLRRETEEWLTEKQLEFFPNKVGVTYWVKLPIENTYTWINNYAIPRFSVAPVPGAFFLFNKDDNIVETDRLRIGLGNINPEGTGLEEALEALGKAIDMYKR